MKKYKILFRNGVSLHKYYKIAHSKTLPTHCSLALLLSAVITLGRPQMTDIFQSQVNPYTVKVQVTLWILS